MCVYISVKIQITEINANRVCEITLTFITLECVVIMFLFSLLEKLEPAK